MAQSPAAAAGQPGAVLEDDDGLLDWNVSPEYLQQLQEKYRHENFPLFMDELPSNLEDNPHLVALQQLAYEGETAKSVAEKLKQEGNNWLTIGARNEEEKLEQEEREKAAGKRDEQKRNKKRYNAKMALECYSAGLDQQCGDKPLEAVLLSNRAQCHLVLGELVSCVNDCRAALRLDPDNVKAYYRAARASLLLELYRQSVAFAVAGLQRDPENAQLKQVKAEAQELWEKRQGKKDSHRQKELSDAKKTPSVSDVLHTRGISVVAPVYSIAPIVSHCSGPYVKRDEKGFPRLFFTVALLLDEVMVSETIVDFDECNCLGDYLSHMFPLSSKRQEGDPDSPSWDVEKKYTVDRLCAYYECGMPGDLLFDVPLDMPLIVMLQIVKRIAGIPVFHILVRSHLFLWPCSSRELAADSERGGRSA
ncbi:tetratricopeptide repeat-containing protein [Besnoitia besnoiti]|uniref:Tetratricopeptide repeat-containing protein n=1 Tax=Besnoitia besnoiti TaxID=94643 RepID=A0A2A9M719_BESBE|nr:tetratricopeptide repeat-containing protein [Besnoitia besnoiti]PFH31686.1 tetratricopeptide repeat-containing protein [Besnoitia besnoiti]